MTIARSRQNVGMVASGSGSNLAAHLRDVQDEIYAVTVAYRDRVRSAILDKLAAALRSAADTHRVLLYEAERAEATEEQIRNYRVSLHTRVIIPLAVSLEEVDPGAAITAAFVDLLDDLSSLAEKIEEEVVSPEPDALYAPSPSDSMYRRGRKLQVRAFRKVGKVKVGAANAFRRLARRPAHQIEPPRRSIPLRRLVDYHATVRLPVELESGYETLHRIVGETIANVGSGVTAHVHAVLEPPAQDEPARDTEVEASDSIGDVSSSDAPDSEPADPADDTAGFPTVAARFEETLHDAAERLASYPPAVNADVPGQTPGAESEHAASAHEASGRNGSENGASGRNGSENEASGRDASEHEASARDALEQDVFESGSFMLDTGRRDVGRGRVVRQRAEACGARWIKWHGLLRSRVVLMGRLLEFRERTIRCERTLTTRVLEEGIRPAEEALAHVAYLLNGLSSSAEAFESGAVADEIRRHLQKALEAVENDAVTVLRDGKYGQKMRTICDDTAAELLRVVRDLPEVVEVNVLEEVNPEDGPKVVELRDHAARAYDAMLVEQIREEIDHLARAISVAQEETESVPGILRFNLGTALEDLEDEANGAARAEALELVVDGLARSAVVLDNALTNMAERAAFFRQRVRQILETGFQTLHERLKVEERMREQMLDFRSDAEAGLRRVTLRASEEARRLAVTARKAYRAGLRNTATWIRMGTQAAGLATTSDEERFATLDVLIDTEKLLDNLPLVYRRIFSFEPLRDPALLVGRDRELRALQLHVDRWRRGLSSALVVTGFHGSGHTSFLNVIRQTVFTNADVSTLELMHRVRTEEELVSALCTALELDPEHLTTLDAIAKKLFTREQTNRLPVCIVEHLEHVFLRQVGGTQLAERFLTFLSRTDSRMIWIVTASDYGWQLIRNAEPAASRLVVVQSLSPTSRPELETIILNRHRRSGLPLRFEPPSAEANPLLLRRLRRATSDQERQDILRTDFFDRLQRASGHHIMMAMMQWLRSTEMDADEGLIRVRPAKPLSFAFLQKLELDQAFTLKAVLEHASLTVEEHSELFLIPRSTSLKHFESLGNLLLIEPIDARSHAGRFDFSAIEEGVRYRIRPLLTNTVIQYLRSRNILH